jgi:hypothetical protein
MYDRRSWRGRESTEYLNRRMRREGRREKKRIEDGGRREKKRRKRSRRGKSEAGGKEGRGDDIRAHHAAVPVPAQYTTTTLSPFSLGTFLRLAGCCCAGRLFNI